MMQTQSGQPIRWSRKSVILLDILLVVFPLLLLAGVEVYLRHTGYGLDGRLFLPTGQAYQLNQELYRRYYPADDPMVKNLIPRVRMKQQKSDDDFRVVCLGGSTTRGPFPALLTELLISSEVNKAGEVVNLGIITFNSYQVLDIVKKLPQYEPDLLIIYMGHNEIYGPLGGGSKVALGTSRDVINLVLRLREFRVYQLAHSLYSSLSASPDRPLKERSPYKRMVNSSLAPRHPLRQQAIENFTGNLREILSIAERQQIPVIVATIVSNLRDWRPFDSEPPPDSLDVAAWQALLERGKAAFEINDLGEAERIYQTAIELFPDHAQTHFDLGHVYLATGDRDKAERAFTTARDLDVLPIRAPSAVNETIRAVAEEADVVLADLEVVFEDDEPESVMGKPVFFEHLHPTILGDYLIAGHLTDVIVGEGFLVAGNRLDFDDPSLKKELGVNLDKPGVARLRQILRLWPFNINNAGYQFP